MAFDVPPPPDTGVSLDDVPVSQGLSLDDPTQEKPIVPVQVASQRAVKADYGLGAKSPGAGSLYTGIATGNEQSLRQGAAVDESVDFMQKRNAMIGQIAAAHGGGLDPTSMKVLLDMSKGDYQSNPQDIFERKFAEQYHTDALQVNAQNSQSPIQKGLTEDPEETLRLADLSQHPTMIREYAKTLGEDLQADISEQGYLRTGKELVGQFAPLVSAWNLHSILQGPNTAASVLPGENLGQGIDHLLRLPYKEAIAKLKEAVEAIKAGKGSVMGSTRDALTLVQAVQSYTSLDSTVNNIVGITDAGGLASLAGKGILKVTGLATRAADTFSLSRAAAQRAAKPATLADTAEAAVKDMAADAGIPPPAPKIYHIPEGVAKDLEGISLPEGDTTAFKTDKSSTYAFDPKAETTVRDRVPHEGDTPKTSTGPQPQSERTYFVDHAAMNEVRVEKGSPNRIVELQDGKIGVSYQQKDGKWSLPFGSQILDTHPSPKPGLAPIEVWDKGPKNTFGTAIYNKVHYGNKITEVTHGESEPVFWTNQAENVGVKSGPAGEGMVPVAINHDHSVQFGPTIKGETYNIPNDAVKRMKGVQKFGRPLEYKASFNKQGEPAIWLDRKNKEYITPNKGPAVPGSTQVTISKAGNIEFVATGAMRDVRKTVADTTKAMSQSELKPAEVLSQVGDVDKAASVIAVQRVAEPAAGTLLDSLPSGMNPTNFFGKGSALTQAYAGKIIDRFTNQTKALLDVLGKLDVSRLTKEAITVGVEQTKNELKSIYGGRVNDGWIDFLHIPPELNPNKANLDTVIGRLGDLNSRAFESRKAAELYMKEVYKFGEGEAHVGQQGNSFYVQVARHVDETTDAIRQANITPKNSTPVSMFNMALNRLRTSEDLLADFQRNNRHVATHAPQIINKLLREQIDETARGLTKQQRKNVEAILRINRDEINPLLGPNKRGNFYRSDADFSQAYMGKFQQLPTDREIEHYFNYTRVSDFDYTIRNLAMYRDKGRLGIQQFSFSFPDSAGAMQKLPFFEGKERDTFPWGGQNAGILIHDSKSETRLLYKHGKDGVLDTTARETIDKLIKERGFKVVQVFNPTVRPFQDVDFLKGKISEQIHFVVTDTSERKALAFQQLEYRPGGHSIYMDDWYVKQPQLQIGQAGRLQYYGDNAIMNFATQAEAVKYAERMDIARIMYKNNDPRLEEFLSKNIPYSVDDFKKIFNKGHLDLETPIVHTKSGASAFDTVSKLKPEYRDAVDATKSEYNLAGSIDSSFTADRNLVLDTVQEKNGFMAIAPGRQLDPYEAMNRGLGQGIRNLWMNDYKIQAVQSWIEEFGDVMKPKFKELSNNPMFFLYNPQWNEAAVDKARLAAAKTSQRAIVNFVGAQSELGGQIQFLQNKLASTIYELGSFALPGQSLMPGLRQGQRNAQFFSDHLLPAIRDPASYVRAVAFHSKLGLFNPVQMFVQAQSLANVIAIAGAEHGVPGSAAAFLMRRMAHTVDPAVIDHFGEMASKLGWKKEDFLEMYSAFRKTGLYEVAGEAALRDDVFDPKLYRSTLGAFLDKGTMFFNEGERAVRLAAFATAYREAKVKGLAELGNREIGDIMSRADTLSASMTRASAASWQTGLVSIPLQFAAYNARIAEQFFSKRLSTAEKLRMFGTYSALYGVPTTLAAVAGVWPFYDDIREAAISNGVDMSPLYMKALSEGVISAAFSKLTGHDYNFAQRYGPGGTSIFKDFFDGDKSALATIGGASGSIIGDIWHTTQPVFSSLAALFKGQSDTFPSRHEDYLAIVNNASTANLVTRIYTALQYGKYLSKNNVQVGDMDGMDAVMSILGVSPQQIADTYIGSKVEKADKKGKEGWENAAISQYGLGMSALERGDAQGFHDYMSRFNAYMDNGDFTMEDRDRIEKRASEYKPDLSTKVHEDLWRKSPLSKMDDRFKQMQSFFTNGNK